MSWEGLLLCGLLTGADYGVTREVLKRPGTQEVGPLARHSLALGAGVKTGACLSGEVALRKRRKARWIYRGLHVALTGAVVAHNLRQGRERP